MGDETFLLTLEVDGRKYPLRIRRSEEEAYRKATHTLNNKINQYRAKFGSNPTLNAQDFITLTAIQAMVENFSIGRKNDTKPFEDTIDSLIKEMDDFLRR